MFPVRWRSGTNFRAFAALKGRWSVTFPRELVVLLMLKGREMRVDPKGADFDNVLKVGFLRKQSSALLAQKFGFLG